MEFYQNPRTQHITGSLLVVAFMLRLSATLFGLLQKEINPLIPVLFEYLTYWVIALLIFFNRHNLALHRIDRASLFLFFIGSTILRPLLKGEPGIISLLVFWGITIWLIVVFRREKIYLQKISIIWLLIGLAVGCLLAFFLSLPLLRIINLSGSTRVLVLQLLFGFCIYISHSAILEEPLFRGFLWGYLQSKGWKNISIWIFQAGLFWIMHMNYISKPYTFWVVVPITGLVFGLLVWRSGSIAPDIMAHAAFNDLVGLLFRNITI